MAEWWSGQGMLYGIILPPRKSTHIVALVVDVDGERVLCSMSEADKRNEAEGSAEEGESHGEDSGRVEGGRKEWGQMWVETSRASAPVWLYMCKNPAGRST